MTVDINIGEDDIKVKYYSREEIFLNYNNSFDEINDTEDEFVEDEFDENDFVEFK